MGVCFWSGPPVGGKSLKQGPLGFTSSVTRSARGWVTSQTAPNPDGTGPLLPSVTTYELDPAGNRVATINPLGRRWETDFDAQDRPVEWRDPRGGITRVTFDLAGRQTELVDPVGNSTRWGFDDADRRISETDPRNSVRTLVYNGLTVGADAVLKTWLGIRP